VVQLAPPARAVREIRCEKEGATVRTHGEWGSGRERVNSKNALSKGEHISHMGEVIKESRCPGEGRRRVGGENSMISERGIQGRRGGSSFRVSWEKGGGNLPVRGGFRGVGLKRGVMTWDPYFKKTRREFKTNGGTVYRKKAKTEKSENRARTRDGEFCAAGSTSKRGNHNLAQGNLKGKKVKGEDYHLGVDMSNQNGQRDVLHRKGRIRKKGGPKKRKARRRLQRMM